jgi:hypothetical protein
MKGNQMIQATIEQELSSMGAKLVDYNRYENGSENAYVVLANWNGKTVCWVFNTYCKGFYWGVYGAEAEKVFRSRTKKA